VIKKAILNNEDKGKMRGDALSLNSKDFNLDARNNDSTSSGLKANVFFRIGDSVG